MLKMNGAPFTGRPVVFGDSSWVVSSAHTKGHSGAGLRFAAVDLADWPKGRFSQERLVGGTGEWRFMPTIAVSAKGVLIAHTVASDSQLPAVAYTWRAHSDGRGTLRPPRLLKVSDTTFRANDNPQLPHYIGAAADPVDGTFWLIGQYATSATAAGAWVGHLEIRQ